MTPGQDPVPMRPVTTAEEARCKNLLNKNWRLAGAAVLLRGATFRVDRPEALLRLLRDGATFVRAVLWPPAKRNPDLPPMMQNDGPPVPT